MCTPTPSLLKHGGVGKDSMCKWFNWLAPVRQLSIETSDCQVMKFIINISDQIGSDDRYLISSNVPIFPISDTRHLDWSFTNYHSHKVRKSICWLYWSYTKITTKDPEVSCFSRFMIILWVTFSNHPNCIIFSLYAPQYQCSKYSISWWKCWLCSSNMLPSAWIYQDTYKGYELWGAFCSPFCCGSSPCRSPTRST